MDAHRAVSIEIRRAFARALIRLMPMGGNDVSDREEPDAMRKPTEIETLRARWNREAERTVRLLEALPQDQYDFRPDPGSRSIGELAWHLSEIDACLSFGIAASRFRLEDEPPGLARPREIARLAPGYRRIHEEAVARIESLASERLDDEVVYFDGRSMSIRDVLVDCLLAHLVHHRGQLALMCRMAGGTPPGLYGPNREEMAALQARARQGQA
jgi:uncharacterized damage-inducible protein DinB